MGRYIQIVIPLIIKAKYKPDLSMILEFNLRSNWDESEG
jgi:hypothetical protein